VITRTRHTADYTVVPNAIQRELSHDARAVLGWYLSRRPGHRPHSTRDAKAMGIGRDRLRRVMRELMEAGYMTRLQTRRTDGRWGCRTVVYDTPADQPICSEAAGQTRDWDSVPGVLSSVSTYPSAQRTGGAAMSIRCEEDPAAGGYDRTQRKRARKGEAAPRKTRGLTAWVVTSHFERIYRAWYPRTVPPSLGHLCENIAYWHRGGVDPDGNEVPGVKYEVIDLAVRNFFLSVKGTLVAPADKVFIKQARQWIDEAAEGYYRDVELPAIQADYRRRRAEWYEEMRTKLAAVDPTISFTPGVAERVLRAAGVDYSAWRG
jgi:hypothetical protein